MSREVYLRFEEGAICSVDTSYGHGADHKSPLLTVFHLIKAAVSTENKELLGIPDKHGQLSLHLPVGDSINVQNYLLNDSDTALRADCPLSSLSSYATTSDDPFIIKRFFKKVATASILHDNGIDINSEHLKRTKLVFNLYNQATQFKFVRLTSPSSSGKSSLLTLFQQYIESKNESAVWVSFLGAKSAVELLNEAGIDLNRKTTTLGSQVTFVFIDDAQKKFDDKSFWERFLKHDSMFLPATIHFIISSTFLLPGGIDSPTELTAFRCFARNDFLLSYDEANEFLELSKTGLPEKMKYKTFKDVLINECGGLIGALRISIDTLRTAFDKNIQPSESELLQYVFSDIFVIGMSRCFGSIHSKPVGDDFELLLVRIFTNKGSDSETFSNSIDAVSFSNLKKAGILVEHSGNSWLFSSPLAKRYYLKWLFPDRSQEDENPPNLYTLIRLVISNMSANTLKKSTLDGFPKEATFQHLFMSGLSKFTKSCCSICPELSKIFPRDSDSISPGNISGEIDFYLNNTLRWGIELLVNGNGVGDHISRFEPGQKYGLLDCLDYVVVDLRGNDSGDVTRIIESDKRISVFFKIGDYSVAKCIFGISQKVEVINLRY